MAKPPKPSREDEELWRRVQETVKPLLRRQPAPDLMPLRLPPPEGPDYKIYHQLSWGVLRQASRRILSVAEEEWQRIVLDIHDGPVQKLFALSSHLALLQAQLDDKKVVLEVEPEARLWLAERGYDRMMGARPMQRLIQDELKKPLAEKILFGELAEHGGVVHVSVGEDGRLRLEVMQDHNEPEPA